MQFYQSSVKAYLACRMLLCTAYLSGVALYNAHLSIECLLKSLTAKHSVQPAFEHDLTNLNKKLIDLTSDPDLKDESFLEYLSELNPYQELGRYGALSRPANDPGRVDTPELKAFGVTLIQPSSEIRLLDRYFKMLHDKLNPNNDPIELIIEGRKDTTMSHDWKLPMDVQSVLLTNNESFNKK